MNGFMKCSLARLGSLSGLAIFVMACGSDPGNEQGLVDVFLACQRVTAEGHTEGDVRRLVGKATFHFGDTDRESLVGLYVFELREAVGGLNATLNYQFVLGDGDSFLTSDLVFMEPFLVPDEYRFNVAMTIVAGGGLFAEWVGTKPFVLDAVFTISPPNAPGDLQAASEKFTMTGRLCGD